MPWTSDTNLHIHSPLQDSEKAVLEKATRHAKMFGNPDVLVDVKAEGIVNGCICGSQGRTNFYWVILHYKV